MKTSKNIENSLEKCVFRIFRKLDFGTVLGVGSAAKVVSKRSRGTSHEKKFMLIILTILLAQICKNIEKSLEKCVFGTCRKFHFKGVLGGGVRARMALRWL